MCDDEIGRGAGNFFRVLAPHNLLDPEFVPEIKFVICTKNGNDARCVKHFQQCEFLHRMFQAEICKTDI
jgi:hypothetical protein